MAYQHNNAYAGRYTLPNGAGVVEVEYFDRERVAATFGQQISRQPDRKSVGWYWRQDGSEWFGPYRGSLQAMLGFMGPASPLHTTMGAEPGASPA